MDRVRDFSVETRKSGVSLKYKLLALLIALPVFSLALYLMLAVRLFEKDKIAYVFDASVAVSRTVAAQVASELRSEMSRVKPLLEGFDLSSRQFDRTARALFAKEASLQWLGVLGAPGDGIAVLNKPGFSLSVQEVRSLALDSCKRDVTMGVITGVKLPVGVAPGSLIWIAFCASARPAIMVTDGSRLLGAFSGESGTRSFLVGSGGVSVFDPSVVFSGWDFFGALHPEKSRSGALEAQSPQKENTLVSYAFVGNGDLRVITIVPKQEALKAAKVLVSKSLLFLVALLSLGVIISVFASHRLTSTLRELVSATRKIAEGNFNVDLPVRSRDEVGNLATSFNRMAGEVSRLMSENITKARMEKELETAKTVQETLFPATVANIGGVRIAGHYEPASECGGDWWHYAQVGDRLFLWIGDVTGHGAPAALITSAAKSAATIIQTIPGITTASAMALLNRAIHETSKGSLQMTFFLGAWDLKTGELNYSKASHNPPLLLKKENRPLTKEDILFLDENNGPRLGEKWDAQYVESKILLGKEDVLWFYTDGVVELENKDHQEWGERNFLRSLIAASNAGSSEARVDTLRAQLMAFRGGAPLRDDVTFFTCGGGV